MYELLACSAAVLVFAALWIAVFKFGGLDWTADPSLAGAHRQLSDVHLALDGEMHGAAQRLSASAASRPARRERPRLFDVLARHAHLSVPS